VPWQASFVGADKASLDVLRWAVVDQTLLTAAILNLAINARNAMPNEGTQEARREHRGAHHGSGVSSLQR
jgi:hypothetical protein